PAAQGCGVHTALRASCTTRMICSPHGRRVARPLLHGGTMKRLVGIFAIVVLATACDTGSVGDDGDDGSADEILCMAELGVTGTFAESATQPIDVQGCWPIGTWTFTTTIVSNDCTP